ncbi:hypothetical protein BT63DRAFT_3359 [Microthyrium microscopicum]|uniref:Uncharacterized protein n=1 Tax=Microthyrium microscopicum TaxID=703497 RepID=A0A6A6UST0_9PEZI|nr:hypothetical protein BT63DRAFT_3359 [Microthyrium microscopicum]
MATYISNPRALMPDPPIFWAVTDLNSRKQWVEGQGLMAEIQDASVKLEDHNEKLRTYLENHFRHTPPGEPRSPPTPIISVFDTEARARSEVTRRSIGYDEVIHIIKIDLRRTLQIGESVELEHVDGAFHLSDLLIEPIDGMHTIGADYIFLNRIPESVCEFVWSRPPVNTPAEE